jgi:hypothetical protein
MRRGWSVSCQCGRTKHAEQSKYGCNSGTGTDVNGRTEGLDA